jgi:hypothetical protein
MKILGVVKKDIYFRDFPKRIEDMNSRYVCFVEGKEVDIHGYFIEEGKKYFVGEAEKAHLFEIAEDFISVEGDLPDLNSFDCGLPIVQGTQVLEQWRVDYGPYHNVPMGKMSKDTKAILLGVYSRSKENDSALVFFPGYGTAKSMFSGYFEPISEDEKRRLSIIAQLKRLDRNGVWSDRDSNGEGMDFLTLEEAEGYLNKLSNPE